MCKKCVGPVIGKLLSLISKVFTIFASLPARHLAGISSTISCSAIAFGLQIPGPLLPHQSLKCSLISYYINVGVAERRLCHSVEEPLLSWLLGFLGVCRLSSLVFLGFDISDIRGPV